jgi:hypothetical protein
LEKVLRSQSGLTESKQYRESEIITEKEKKIRPDPIAAFPRTIEGNPGSAGQIRSGIAVKKKLKDRYPDWPRRTFVPWRVASLASPGALGDPVA